VESCTKQKDVNPQTCLVANLGTSIDYTRYTILIIENKKKQRQWETVINPVWKQLGTE
jgi:hypothetical protein